MVVLPGLGQRATRGTRLIDGARHLNRRRALPDVIPWEESAAREAAWPTALVAARWESRPEYRCPDPAVRCCWTETGCPDCWTAQYPAPPAYALLVQIRHPQCLCPAWIRFPRSRDPASLSTFHSWRRHSERWIRLASDC